MIAKQFLIATTLGLAVCGSAMADGPSGDFSGVTSERLRADVKAEVMAARRAGTLMPAGELIEVMPRRADYSMARSTVKAEVMAARAAGELLSAGEADYPGTHARLHSTRTRDEVKAEVLAARQAGQLLPAGEIIAMRQAHGSDAASTNQARRLATLAHVVK